MTPEQLARMQARMHQMVDGLFEGPTRGAMLEGWAWPAVRITFASRDDPDDGYTLAVGVEPPDADS